MKKIILALLLASSSIVLASNNVFISYFSPTDVDSLVKYETSHQLGGYILWDVSSDMPYDASSANSLSLLGHVSMDDGKQSAPMVMAYYTDWSVYGGHAQPTTPYPIPGSVVVDGQGNSTTQSNADLTAKLNGLNVLNYSFLEIDATATDPNVGTVYFNDPNADLFAADKNSTQDAFCKANAVSCWTATYQGKPVSGQMGNFVAFTQLQNTTNTLQKFISIGGYSHDDGFEAIFADATGNAEKNFIQSTLNIVNGFKLNGVDLDYENPQMTYAESDAYAKLVQDLRKALPSNVQLTVALLASPAYLEGSNNNVGFDPNDETGQDALATIVNAVSHVDLMSYDFHGAFDYNPNGGTDSNTGLLSQINAAPGEPFVNNKFNDDATVAALQTAIKSTANISNKVVLGIPAYGRALAGISAGTNGTGLFQPITSSSSILPGDLDAQGCDTSIVLNANSCSGTFSYHFIVNNLLTQGFTATQSNDSNGNANGVSAYAANWGPASSNYTVEITNNGTGSTAQGMIVAIKSSTASFASDYLAPGADKSYDAQTTNPSLSQLEGQSNLVVSWSTWAGGPQGTCPNTFNLTQNTHIMVSVVANNSNGTYATACTIAAN
jgi:GH18 family chitinase